MVATSSTEHLGTGPKNLDIPQMDTGRVEFSTILVLITVPIESCELIHLPTNDDITVNTLGVLNLSSD